jgi:hypothetical protein
MALIDNVLTFDQDAIDAVATIATIHDVPVHQISLTMVCDHVEDQELDCVLATNMMSYLYDVHEKRVVYGNDQEVREESLYYMTSFDQAINEMNGYNDDTIISLPMLAE